MSSGRRCWTRTHSRDPSEYERGCAASWGRGPRPQAKQALTECADPRRRCRTGGSAHGDARLHAWRACNARMFPAAYVDPSCRGHRHPPSTWRIQFRQRKRRRNSGRKTTRAGPHCATPCTAQSDPAALQCRALGQDRPEMEPRSPAGESLGQLRGPRSPRRGMTVTRKPYRNRQRRREVPCPYLSATGRHRSRTIMPTRRCKLVPPVPVRARRRNQRAMAIRPRRVGA
ncbi:hypothetical protein AIIKEEIJ_03083 [Rhodococcus sp. YH1]|nr:hypothetical protein [Rhodococcus sp. YH1]